MSLIKDLLSTISPEEPAPKAEPVWCYFCGRPQHETQTIIKQDEIGICDACVRLCAQMLNEQGWKERYERWREFAP
jgi:hypothetical protein